MCYFEAILKRTSLQRLFILPFAALLLCLAVSVGWLLYQAGQDATDALSQKVLADMMGGINSAINRQLFDAGAALRVVAPDQIADAVNKTPTPIPFPANVRRLEERMWIASGLFPTVGGFIGFAGVDGHFVGIRRTAANEFRVRLRGAGDEPSHLYRSRGPAVEMTFLETEEYEPRTQSWYLNAASQKKDAWSPVFIEAASNEPALMLARPVFDVSHELLGVVARELSLKPLREYLQALPMDRNGVAYIVERNGDLIAASNGENVFLLDSHDKNLRIRNGLASVASPFMRQSWQLVQSYLQKHPGVTPITDPVVPPAINPPKPGKLIIGAFPSSSGPIEVAAQLHRDAAGLEWIAVVALPRSDFWGAINSSVYKSLYLGLLVILLALLVGYGILRWALRDIRKLTLAVRSIGSGRPFAKLNIDRKDEIGELAESFQEMERHLSTDRLTSLLNRDSLIAQIEFRRRTDVEPQLFRFAVLFVDLDKFKQVNDHYGHDEGDRVLIEVGLRLQNALRKEDEVARFGGDEFIVYLPGVADEESALAISEKIYAVLNKPILMANGDHCQIGASIGGALYPADGLDLETLLKVADKRMYSVKKFGGLTFSAKPPDEPA
ncbi:diguanylate cyclase domain protein [Collimonas pratensis]|uniref:Diguanylate cyclase domain protein n=2 Tax=Collimonas pratensis TaxID=279113 RepID=A0A127Q5I5_9BURK|nr:diguanylate cyclase domain protein [Collimonas pratensis]